jgi:lysophospholipid acyltransferase 5
LQEELSRDQKEAALPTLPSILEMFSHCFFIGGYFVGPQFSMRKYQVGIKNN